MTHLVQSPRESGHLSALASARAYTSPTFNPQLTGLNDGAFNAGCDEPVTADPTNLQLL